MLADTSLLQKSYVYIPSWVEDLLRRHRLGLDSVFDYEVMRELMSVEDLSAFLGVQMFDAKLNLPKPHKSYLLGSWEQSVREEHRAVLESAVIPQSYSETGLTDAWERLQGNASDNKTYWSVADVRKDVFAVILYPGIVQAIQQPKQILDMIRDILRVFYGYYEIHKVSQLPIFGRYLHWLSHTT